MVVQKQIKLSSVCLKIMSAKPNKNSNVVRILLQIIKSDSYYDISISICKYHYKHKSKRSRTMETEQ